MPALNKRVVKNSPVYFNLYLQSGHKKESQILKIYK